jgi:rubrerythrin
MTNADKRLTDGLLKAIRAERDGQSFYMMAANSSEDPKGREVFAMLAREEHEHMLFLKAHYDSIIKTGKLDSSAKLGKPTELSSMSPIFSESIKSRIQDAHYEMSALSIGIQLEHDAMKFYKAESDAATDPAVKKFFAELADWETGHYRALLAQQDELKQDYWSEGGFSPF